MVEELAREKPSLKNFVTLSPVPQFTAWLERAATDADGEPLPTGAPALESCARSTGRKGPSDAEYAEVETALMALAAHYFLNAKSADGRPVDPVARFHLGNGARLDRINFLADTSEKSMREACGLMVNYRYEPKEIERNHEAYANEGVGRLLARRARPPEAKVEGTRHCRRDPAAAGAPGA